MIRFQDITPQSPLKELRTFVKQEKLDISTQVGGRSHRTTNDIFLDIMEVLKEKQNLTLLQKPLFEGPTDDVMKITSPNSKEDAELMAVEEDVSDYEREEDFEELLFNPSKRPSAQQPVSSTEIRDSSVKQPQPMQTVPSGAPAAPGSPVVTISASGELSWTPWFLFRNQKDIFLDKLPNTPAVYEIGVALPDLGEDHNPRVVPVRDRIRVTNVKYLGSTYNLQQSLKEHCTNPQDKLFNHINHALKSAHDIYVHLFPVKTKGSADKITAKMAFSWVYEWTAREQDRCRGQTIRGKVYFPQKVEVDEDVLEKLQSMKN